MGTFPRIDMGKGNFVINYALSGQVNFKVSYGRDFYIKSIIKPDSLTSIKVGKNGSIPTELTTFPYKILATDEIEWILTYDQGILNYLTLKCRKL